MSLFTKNIVNQMESFNISEVQPIYEQSLDEEFKSRQLVQTRNEVTKPQSREVTDPMFQTTYCICLRLNEYPVIGKVSIYTVLFTLYHYICFSWTNNRFNMNQRCFICNCFVRHKTSVLSKLSHNITTRDSISWWLNSSKCDAANIAALCVALVLEVVFVSVWTCFPLLSKMSKSIQTFVTVYTEICSR